MRIYQIPRNDVAACIAYHDERGGVTPDDLHVMFMLQDDPSELTRVSASWKAPGEVRTDDSRTGLTAARVAADLARNEPTPENRRAALRAAKAAAGRARPK